MGLIGHYLDTFENATHALPEGMSMNADYPFMIPRIIERNAKQITLESERDGTRVTAKIKRDKGREFIVVAQSSTYERLFRRRPTRFKFWPFEGKDT